MKIAQNYAELVGNTPLLRLNRLEKLWNVNAEIVAKIERFNPLSSVKDRLAKALIEAMESEGLLQENSVIIEPTSGNTGVGLAFIAATKGIPLILVMPATVSKERVAIVQALGAQVILTEGPLGMKGAIARAEALVTENPHYRMPQQFKHLANAAMHRQTTAQEILKDTDGNVAVFIAGVGTGGTITGVGESLKKYDPSIRIIAVEPKDSAVLSGGQPGPHRIQGIGAGFVPSILNRNVIDEIITVSNEDAIACTKLVAKQEGVFVGISSGAVLFAAKQVAMRPEFAGQRIVVLLPDTGERYLSTGIFEE